MDGQPRVGLTMCRFCFPLLAWAIAFSSLHSSGSWLSQGCAAPVPYTATPCTAPLTAICIQLPVAEKSVMESLIQTAAELP